MAIAVILIEKLYYNGFLLPIYVVTGGIVYIAMIRTLKVLNADDFGLLTQVVGVRMGEYAKKIILL